MNKISETTELKHDVFRLFDMGYFGRRSTDMKGQIRCPCIVKLIFNIIELCETELCLIHN